MIALAAGGRTRWSLRTLGPVTTVGAVRLVRDVDHRPGDPGLAETLQVAGDLGGGPAAPGPSSPGGKRMSSSASASAGTWLRASVPGSDAGEVRTVVRQTSSVATGYRASRLATVRCSLTGALSPSHG